MSKILASDKKIKSNPNNQKVVDVMQAKTAWGEIRVAWVSGTGVGRGEIHISHDGCLTGHEAALEKVVTTLKGRSRNFGGNIWVVVMNDGVASEKTAQAFIEAISSLATREEAKKQAKSH